MHSLTQTAEVIPVVYRNGTSGRTGSLSVRGAVSAGALERLGYAPVTVRSEPAADRAPYTFERFGSTGVIRIATFGAKRYDAELDQFVADTPRHRELDTIVFDLRGNGGGSDEYVTR